MGLFDFLTGGKTSSNVESRDDRIWLTQAAKFNGIRNDLADCAGSETVAILLIAHFPDTLTRLETLTENWTGAVPVQAVLASNLSTDLASRLHVEELSRMDLIVAERHPLPSVDDALKQFAAELPCRCRLGLHMSLDDPLIRRFVGSWVEDILGKLGMQEDEPIESRLVTRQIRAVQEKVAAQATGNREAASAADWMAKNLPS